MRKLLLILAIGLSLSGCAWLGAQKASFDECWNDPGCRKQAIDKMHEAQVLGATVGSLAPIPGAGAVGSTVAGGLALLIAMISGGNALMKRKKQESILSDEQ